MARGSASTGVRVGAAAWSAALVLVLFLAGEGAWAQGSEAGAPGDRSVCDNFMEHYVRSAARKLDRAISTGDYELEVLDSLGAVLTLEGEFVGRTQPLSFDVYKEASGRVVGLVDRKRAWTQTYIVAVGRSGPIIVSHTWQTRGLRESGQPCEPFTSAVEWPGVTASAVDVEPFKFWGLRASWRIPRADDASSNQSLEEALVHISRRYDGLEPLPSLESSARQAQGEDARDVTKD